MSSRTVSINDTEIERGRHDRATDSSSSRESSPLNKRKRDLSPPSDNDSVVPATAEVDTPPPPERPIVREPVAFRSDTANISTYQASIPPSSSSHKYLPGQDPSTKKGRKTRSKRGGTPFSAQTGRFRLELYEHNRGPQSEVPPLQLGQGPYTSLYRATDELYPPVPNPDPGGVPMGSSNPQSQGSSRPSSKRARMSTDQASANFNSNIFDPNLISMSDPVLYPPLQDHTLYPSGAQQQQQSLNESQVARLPQPQPSQVPVQSASRATSNDLNRESERTNPGMALSSNHFDSVAGRSQPAKRPGFYNRMITILLHDTRSGKIDRQLAEVTVPVKMSDDPQDGFWADARDITEKLQSSPSRIDGPAKVYTLRGKYRQFFLRVSADNVDNYMSANIGITADRTLDVVIEKPPEIGVMPPSPRIPSELLPSSSEVVDTSDLSDGTSRDKYRGRRAMAARRPTKHTTQKHQHSINDDSSDSGLEAHNQRSRPTRKAKTFRGKGTVAMSALDYLPALKDRSDSMGMSLEQMRGYDSPTTDEDPGRLYEMIVRSVEVVIQRQPDGPSYSQWKIGRLPDLLRACGFIQRMMDELVGELAPFRTKTHEIRKSHVLAALRIEPRMASESTEVLNLLKLYGENGTRYCDTRVLDVMVRDDLKPYPQLKLLLRSLRNTHEEWKRYSACQSDTLEEGF